MSCVVEKLSGAILLPPTKDERASLTSWVAHCATNADLRTKDQIWARIAADLEVRNG